MPFGLKPVCATCKTGVSTMWHKNDNGEVACNSCAMRVSAATESEQAAQKDGSGSSCPFTLRKSTRAKSSKLKQQQQQPKTVAPKGKGRRAIFKRGPLKAPSAVATCVTSDYVFFRVLMTALCCKTPPKQLCGDQKWRLIATPNMYFQVGDVISMTDENGDVYYGQIRGLLQDQYCEKSAVITWLIPTKGSPTDHFDPSTYILGPEEDIPRKLECMEFVCHAPSEYFKAKNTPYPTKSSGPESCFIWTRLGPQVQALPTQEQVFGAV